MHPNTKAMVAEFATALATKLEWAEQKYGYRDNWLTDDWEAECRQKLLEHIRKGDPLDVAAYCAFMWKRGWPTAHHLKGDRCPSCKRLFRDGETCSRGGCPMGGDF